MNQPASLRRNMKRPSHKARMIAEFCLQLLHVGIPAEAGRQITEGFNEAMHASFTSSSEAHMIVADRLKREWDLIDEG